MADAPTYVHRKSGGHYTLLGTGRLQSDTPLADMAEIAIYRGEDGRLWARDTQEFAGRFDPATPSPPVAAPPATPGARTELILMDAANELQEMWDELAAHEQGKGRTPTAQDMRRWSKAMSTVEQALVAAQPHPQPAQPLTDARIAELYKELCADPGYKTGTWFAYVVRFVERAHGITSPSTPTPPEVAP